MKISFLMLLVVGLGTGCATTERWGSYHSEEENYNSWGGRYRRNSINYNQSFRPGIGGVDIAFSSGSTRRTHGSWTFNGVTQTQRNSVFDPVECVNCGSPHSWGEGCYSRTSKSANWHEIKVRKKAGDTSTSPAQQPSLCPCGYCD